jgi:hypothetical protein
MIAKIDEAHAALVAGNVGPAGEGNGLANQGLVDQATEVGTHGGKAPQENAGTRLRRTALYSAASARPGQIPCAMCRAGGGRMARPGGITPFEP